MWLIGCNTIEGISWSISMLEQGSSVYTHSHTHTHSAFRFLTSVSIRYFRYIFGKNMYTSQLPLGPMAESVMFMKKRNYQSIPVCLCRRISPHGHLPPSPSSTNSTNIVRHKNGSNLKLYRKCYLKLYRHTHSLKRTN